MPKFITVKLVDAEFISRGEYNERRGWEIPKDENPEDQGYLKDDGNGHIQWDPAEVFEPQCVPVRGENNTVTQKDVDAFIKVINISEVIPNDSGTIITVVTATLANGFTVTESSTCVDPANYDPEVGLMCCMEKIEDKVWFLLGFLLSSAVNGFHKFDADPGDE